MKTIHWAGREWELLDEETGLICAKDILYLKEFDTSNSNMWDSSSLKDWLNDYFIRNMHVDRDTIDGEVRLLEIDYLMKLPKEDRIKTYRGKTAWYWVYSDTLNPIGSPPYARCISIDGLLEIRSANNTIGGVVPVLNLKELQSVSPKPSTKSIVISIMGDDIDDIYCDMLGSINKGDLIRVRKIIQDEIDNINMADIDKHIG